ncbi:MAG: M50 family metallopeptidase [Erysipelotrichaceae bacterium]|nr:M50 family metallopeptidase [Erysipelotrichaceae bacterium]MDD3923621.1 M50 family metallopeptidase [Erysipelotrichaceae bacterium]
MSVIYFLLILGIIILIHELGHLLTAKYFKVYCHEFSFGFGPKLLSKQGKETLYSIRAFPFGGFVRMAGEETLENDVEVPLDRTLNGIKPLKRMIILLSGIIMNIILAVVFFSLLLMMSGYFVKYPEPIISSVTNDSPADRAGMIAQDKIVQITFSDGVIIKPDNFGTIVQYLQGYNDEAEYIIERNNELLTLYITPEYDQSQQRYLMGITMPDIEYKPVNAFNALYYGSIYTIERAGDIFESLVNLIQGRGFKNLSGPVAIFQMTGETMESAKSFTEGVFYFLNIVAILSLNVGIFNLLPVPMLDGGRVLLTGVELISGKPLSKKLEYALINASAILIMMLFVFILWNDLVKLFN